jgi:hypothetical protein
MSNTELITSYQMAVLDRNALEDGFLTAEETAGYWIAEAPHAPLQEFERMLADFGIEPGEDQFYDEVRSLLKEVAF